MFFCWRTWPDCTHLQNMCVCVWVCDYFASVCSFVREKETRLSLEGWRDFVGPVEIRALHLCPQATVCACVCVVKGHRRKEEVKVRNLSLWKSSVSGKRGEKRCVEEYMCSFTCNLVCIVCARNLQEKEVNQCSVIWKSKCAKVKNTKKNHSVCSLFSGAVWKSDH